MCTALALGTFLGLAEPVCFAAMHGNHGAWVGAGCWVLASLCFCVAMRTGSKCCLNTLMCYGVLTMLVSFGLAAWYIVIASWFSSDVKECHHILGHCICHSDSGDFHQIKKFDFEVRTFVIVMAPYCFSLTSRKPTARK